MEGHTLYALASMTRRNLKIFLRDRAAVFFSLLAPLIVLLLYILFLGDVQVESVRGAIPEGVAVEDGAVRGFVDSWMVAGVLSVACITVSLGANSVMVQDRVRGVIRDSMAAPVRRAAVTASYFLYNFIVTAFICLLVSGACLLYLYASGGFFLTGADIVTAIGILLLSALSATTLTVLVTSFFRSESALSAFVGIVSAAVGFVIGAYMPMSIFPRAVQYAVCFIPGTYSASLFRTVLMRGAHANLAHALPDEAAQGIADAFSMRLDFFGAEVPVYAMWLVLAGSALLFALLNILFSARRRHI